MVRFLLGVGMMLNVLIIAAVAFQSSKAEGFGAGLGGHGSTFRGSRTDEFLARATRVLGISWGITFVLLAWFWNNTQSVAE